ncbi:MAG: hypothetical protein FWG70_03420 [Oscillospiraceae bacterium]|nr:hypothetical protein [Oscillospiraceae bacterium]
MKVTKILALIIALAMSLTLAACGDEASSNTPNNDSPANNQGANAETPDNNTPDNGTETPSPNQTTDNGDNDSGTPQDPQGGIFNDGSDVPDNGTPPYIEPPLESHRGDKGYFYATTDYYIVYINDTNPRFVAYYLINFDFDIYTNKATTTRTAPFMDKIVFRSNEAAKESPIGIVVDNVEYGALDGNPLFGVGYTMDEVISKLDELGYAYYVSQP